MEKVASSPSPHVRLIDNPVGENIVCIFCVCVFSGSIYTWDYSPKWTALRENAPRIFEAFSSLKLDLVWAKHYLHHVSYKMSTSHIIHKGVKIKSCHSKCVWSQMLPLVFRSRRTGF